MGGERELHRRLNAIGSTSIRFKENARLGSRAVFFAKAKVPRKTAMLARSIRVEMVTPESVRVAAGGTGNVGYAAFVEFGTKPHDIVPRNGKVLRFATGGNRRLSGSPRSGAPVVFAKRVHHPGTKAQPYLVPGAVAALEESGRTDFIVHAWNSAA